MLTKNLQLLRSTVIVFEVLQLLWEHDHNTWTILDENNDCRDEDDAEEADDDGPADEDLLIYKLIIKCILKHGLFLFLTGL